MVKLIQEKIGSTLDHIGICNNVMNRTTIDQQLRANINKWDCMKQKLLYSKRNSHQTEENGRKFLPAIHLTRD
jgi:hypothetical protein